MHLRGETLSNARDIIKAAVEARTIDDAERVNQLIQADVGERFQRPVGDRWNNFGLMASSGSYEYKALEPVTNMQDSELERLALIKYGDMLKVPYRTPGEAAQELLADSGYRDVADRITVTFSESDPPASTSKRLSITYRDRGCGLEPAYVPRSIFALGSRHKSKAIWQQGAFGIGGASTYRNAKAVILVTRRAPELNPEEDKITVAIVTWERQGKIMSASYLTTEDWDDDNNPAAEPWSTPASEFPDFDPGTHLTLISYDVEGFHRARSGDEKSFDTVSNTRLFEPVTPIRFTNEITRGKNEYLRGLGLRLETNRRPDRPEGKEHLPFNIDGETYHLPVKFYVFSAPSDSGERRNFVARNHAVVFTSNGQVHHHWTPQEFRHKTKLRKLYDRIFVVVKTDELPIELRTELFTPDRSSFLSSDNALRLEEQVAAFLSDWDALKQIDGELIREAVSRSSGSESAIDVARQISRALKVRGGFSVNGSGNSGGGRGGSVGTGGKRKTIELYPDPTTLEGPAETTAEDGSTKFIRYTLNARDDFMPARGELKVACDHPEINDREITLGELRNGYLRVSIAVPEGTDLGEYTLEASVTDWFRAGGGLGADLRFPTKLYIVDEVLRPGPGRNRNGSGGSDQGELVGVIWSNTEEHTDWHNGVPGHVDQVPAATLADRPEYSSLRALGDVEVPTIFLNEDYGPLKQYVGARARDLTQRGVDDVRHRYAVGTGLGLLYLDQRFTRRIDEGEHISDEVILDASQAIARSVLSTMPSYDNLLREVGIG
jgi:hypothetical protein